MDGAMESFFKVLIKFIAGQAICGEEDATRVIYSVGRNYPRVGLSQHLQALHETDQDVR